MLEQEKLIKQQRAMEATKKNLMGLEGKFGVILKYLGEPIIGQTSRLYDSTPMIHVWDFDYSEDLPTMDEEEVIYSLGRHFTGLSRGIHIEITYSTDEKKLAATYKGHPIYCEVENELECYVPMREWEAKIDSLYKLALEKQRRIEPKLMKEKKEEENKEKLGFLQELRKRWGI